MLFVVKSQRVTIVVLPAALAEAHGLLAVGRNERFPADHTVFLTIVVIAALGLLCRFLLNLGVNMAAVFEQNICRLLVGVNSSPQQGQTFFVTVLPPFGQLLRLRSAR